MAMQTDRLIALGAALSVALGFVNPAAAEKPAKAAAVRYDPRDLSGFWQMTEGPYLSPQSYERAARLVNPDLKEVPFTDPKTFPNRHPPLPIQFTPEFEAIRKQLQANMDAGHPYRTGFNCQPNGPWAMMVNNGPVEIFKDRNRFMFFRVPIGTHYIVYVGREHLKDFAVPEIFGDSVGRWDGNTLVVDSINLGAHEVLTESDPHSQSLRVVQRLRRPSYDRLIDDITAIDARAFVHPVRAHLEFRLDPKGEFEESQCMGETHGTPMAEAPE